LHNRILSGFSGLQYSNNAFFFEMRSTQNNLQFRNFIWVPEDAFSGSADAVRSEVLDAVAGFGGILAAANSD
jgi:hypothetical protein